MQVTAIEQDGEGLLSALARERMLVGAGLKTELELSPIFARFGELCSVESFERIRDEPIEERRQRALQELVSDCVLGDAVCRREEEIAGLELGSKVEWLGQVLSLRDAIGRCLTEPDRERRQALDSAVRAEVAAQERTRTHRLIELRAAAELFGWSRPRAQLAELRRLDLGDLATVARALLERTADPYDQALRDQLAHHQLDRGDVWECDLDWILRGAEYDGQFAGSRFVPSVYRTLAALGISLQDQSNLRIDLVARPLKQREPACWPVAVPDEVHVTARLFGGRADFSALLRLVGEGEPYAQVDRTQPLEYRRLGDGATRRAFGLLFPLLLLDPRWLVAHLETDAIRDGLRLAGLEILAGLRRAAGLVLFEVELDAAEEPDQVRELYADRLSEALGVRAFPERYLCDEHEPLASVDRLRAWMLAGQLLLFLRREFDEEWFHARRAGDFLRDLWRGGNRYTAEELARHLGFEGLDASPLIVEASTAIGD